MEVKTITTYKNFYFLASTKRTEFQPCLNPSITSEILVIKDTIKHIAMIHIICPVVKCFFIGLVEFIYNNL